MADQRPIVGLFTLTALPTPHIFQKPIAHVGLRLPIIEPFNSLIPLNTHNDTYVLFLKNFEASLDQKCMLGSVIINKYLSTKSDTITRRN